MVCVIRWTKGGAKRGAKKADGVVFLNLAAISFFVVVLAAFPLLVAMAAACQGPVPGSGALAQSSEIVSMNAVVNSRFPALAASGSGLAFYGEMQHGDWSLFLATLDVQATQVGDSPYRALVAVLPPVGWRHAPEPIAISGDGQVVAFQVVRHPDTKWGSAIAVASLGQTDRGEILSDIVTLDLGGNVASGYSMLPALSHDGRLVAFMSSAADLVESDSNGADDVFLCDLGAAGNDSGRGLTVRVSVATDGGQSNGDSGGLFGYVGPSLSSNGDVVVFVSAATNLDASAQGGLFVRSLNGGWTRSIPLLDGGCRSFQAAAGGGAVAYEVVKSIGGGLSVQVESQVYVLDLDSWLPLLISVDASGRPGNGSSYCPSISADGRFIAFLTTASSLPGDSGLERIIVVDRGSGGDDFSDRKFWRMFAVQMPGDLRGCTRVRFGAEPQVMRQALGIAGSVRAGDVVGGPPQLVRLSW